ncbi:hypothetical protein PanWU01x14_327620 [Parasponia andersonii]|uniref:Uncharacterized protein n=1 Tax=Parasponia andersonii TaxID=3476 RepID=A0A2P5AJ13_PARAD|nr:hypothetical protein PanWU01x14_327620 [Parasponia andersonii]
MREVGRGEMVKPKKAIDVVDAVVDDKFEEFYGFEFEGDKRAEGLDMREKSSITREGDWFRQDLYEREDLVR